MVLQGVLLVVQQHHLLLSTLAVRWLVAWGCWVTTLIIKALPQLQLQAECRLQLRCLRQRRVH